MDETLNSSKYIANRLGGLVNLSSSINSEQKNIGYGHESVLNALNEFDACVRYLNTRRSSGAVINIQSEADVQDVLYLLLRPWIVDLVYESPADKTGNRYTIKDFSSASGFFVIDAKYIRDRDHGRNISKELHDDIEMYRTHPNCNYLIFFIYDPNAFIPDQRALRETIEIVRSYGTNIKKDLKCYLVVKP